MAENNKELSEEGKTLDLAKEADYLNKAFGRETPAYEVIDRIRRFPRPIVVDFNNVIANNRKPLQANPEAKGFLCALRGLGNVFIITTAHSWDTVYQFLQKNKLWDPNIVLMTSPNYSFISQHEENHPFGKSLRKEFLSMAKSLGWDFSEDELIQAPAGKRVAPIFNKPWKIPIIDDSWMATTNNPGMLGICVKTFEPNPYFPSKLIEKGNKTRPSLAEAVEIVQKHYSQQN